MNKNKIDKGRKWDGKSRVSNDLYRKRYDEIFGSINRGSQEEVDQDTEEYLKEIKNKL
jgi:hypothetical protein|tara:strand:- start:367 stop:540 length:174 start_codon:yes stop_codon:yes gene_type:complete